MHFLGGEFLGQSAEEQLDLEPVGAPESHGSALDPEQSELFEVDVEGRQAVDGLAPEARGGALVARGGYRPEVLLVVLDLVVVVVVMVRR